MTKLKKKYLIQNQTVGNHGFAVFSGSTITANLEIKTYTDRSSYTIHPVIMHTKKVEN